YLGETEKEPMKTQKTFEFDKRIECGTDIYIVGFNQKKGWSKKIISSLLENFMVAIHKEILIIKVGNTEITKDIMSGLIRKIKGRKFDEIKNDNSTIIDNDVLKIKLDEKYERNGFKKDDNYNL